MSCQVDNNAFEMVITPSRKRKRNSDRIDAVVEYTSPAPAPPTKLTAGLTNAAFSSTPKKQAKFLIESYNRFAEKCPINKENAYPVNSCLEVKSILDIVVNKKSETGNPFEVVRKPPKKKKKADIEDVCFVNPALNLDVPEKTFNPFEVRRTPPPIPKVRTCFTNPCLNIRAEDNVLNPYEITRLRANTTMERSKDGIANLAMDMPPTLTIGIPFTPRVGCRIDFKNLPLDSLTPSKLFSEKLVFSPVNPVPKTPRTFATRSSLSAISEEAVDIGKELDCYQLELENSINEAKMRKANENNGHLIEVIQGRVNFVDRLEEIQESESENTIDEDALKLNQKEPKTPILSENCEITFNMGVPEIPVERKEETSTDSSLSNDVFVIPEITEHKSIQSSETIEATNTEDDTRQSDNDSFFDDDLNSDFKAPAPFVRAYRKADPPLQHVSKESVNSDHKTNSKENITEGKNKFGLIRKSIRRLMHPASSGKTVNEKSEEKRNADSNKSHHLFENIRHSLRRRPNKTPKISSPDIKDHEISIIDVTERKSKFKSNLIHTDYLRIEEVTKEPKISLRNSIRKSTREMKNHVLKSVFKKNVEEYEFQK